MINLFCITLPCTLSVIFTLLLMMKKDRNVSDNIFMALTVCCSLYFFAEQNYISEIEDYDTYIIADIMSQYARPLIPPLMVLYLHSLIRRVKVNWFMIASFATSVIIGSVAMSIYVIMGFDNAAMYIDADYDAWGEASQYAGRIYWLHKIVCEWIYKGTIVVCSIIGLGMIVWLFRGTKFKAKEVYDFLFKGGEIEPAHLIGMLFVVGLVSIFIKLGIGKYWFVEHQGCSAVFCLMRAVLVFCIGHVGLRSDRAALRLRVFEEGGYATGRMTDYTEDKPYQVNDFSEECADIVRFGEIVERRLFLTIGIGIAEMAESIGTNKGVLSKYINSRYGCTYKEYINHLRIEYSKDYMLSHPDTIQDVVAEECGFPDAPSFNKKFKSIVGKSPRMWKMMEMEK